MRKLKNQLVLWLMRTRVYKWALSSLIPYIRFTTYYTSLRGNKYHEGYRLLRPGSIILTVDRKKLTSLLIPGTMSHAALCVYKRPPHDAEMGVDAYEIAEMTHNNYTRSDFFDVCKEADRVLIMQCLDWDMDYTAAVVDACLSLSEAKYDVEFGLGIEALYCSELIYQSDRLAAFYMRSGIVGAGGVYGKLRVDLSDLAGLGRKYLSPDGILFAKNIRCVWDSDGEFQGKLGEEIERLV